MEGGSKYHLKWAVIGLPEKRHLNGCRWHAHLPPLEKVAPFWNLGKCTYSLRGWGSRHDGQKTVWTMFFFSSPQLIFQFKERVQWQLILQFTEGSNGFITVKTAFPRIQRGSNIFRGGGGVEMLISIETHITCDWGSPPLDPHMGPNPHPLAKNHGYSHGACRKWYTTI